MDEGLVPAADVAQAMPGDLLEVPTHTNGEHGQGVKETMPRPRTMTSSPARMPDRCWLMGLLRSATITIGRQQLTAPPQIPADARKILSGS